MHSGNNGQAGVRSRRWVWAIGALALVEIGGLSAYMMQPAPVNIEVQLATPRELCMAQGAARYEARGEWPKTSDGRDSRAAIEALCTLDLKAFQPASGASSPNDLT